jgi:hypothetical protein
MISSQRFTHYEERGQWTRSHKTNVESVAEINLNDFMNMPRKH